MSSNFAEARKKRIGWLLNAAIVAAFLTTAGILVKRSFDGRPAAPMLAPSAQIFIEGVDWARSEQTLLIAVSKGCEYCSKSGRFYRRLLDGLKGRQDVRAVVVYPDETRQGEAYLGAMGLTPVESKHEALPALGIRLVPTLALVDRNGVVSKVWLGELSPKKQSEVMAALRLGDTRPVSEWTMGESDLKRRVADGEVIFFVDLRDRGAYASGHLDGAKNIPWDEIYARAKNELPQNKTLVLYSDDEIQADVAYSDLFRLGYTNVFIYTPASKAP
jgi:rhodanese-related sulfurtransferase